MDLQCICCVSCVHLEVIAFFCTCISFPRCILLRHFDLSVTFSSYYLLPLVAVTRTYCPAAPWALLQELVWQAKTFRWEVLEIKSRFIRHWEFTAPGWDSALLRATTNSGQWKEVMWPPWWSSLMSCFFNGFLLGWCQFLLKSRLLTMFTSTWEFYSKYPSIPLSPSTSPVSFPCFNI